MVINTNDLKINGQTVGSKLYDRDFLMKLRDIPQCKIKPSYLINRFEDIHKTHLRITDNWVTPRVNGFNTKSHPLFPSFAKPASYQLPQLERRSSSQGNYARPRNSGMIHVSLSLNEGIKLRKSENAWKPTLLKKKTATEEDEETQLLYKKVRSVLNKLTPEKFDKLVSQVRALEIDTEDKLQGVINLVFDKAIDEPNFAVAYVLMCKELALMKVNAPNEKNPSSYNTGNAATNVNFRKLLINRCQAEFEKNKTNETTRVEKIKEINECKDGEKKKELEFNLAEYDRRIRLKSVGNIKFIGELYKQRMLTSNIMNLCVNQLLKTPDEENLECLCKLLTTIGKIFEEKNDLSLYFNKLTELMNQKGKNKISSRIRFMIQDVIDLRLSNWISRHDNSNPKTISQIQKEVETEQFISDHLNTPSNPSQNFRSDNRRRSLMGPPNNLSNGWSLATSKPKISYTIQTSKLKINTTSIDEITLGSKNSYTWNKPIISPTVPTLLSPNKFSVLDTKYEDQNSRRRSYIGSRSTGFFEKSNDQSYQRGTNFLQNNSQQRNCISLYDQRLSFFNNTQNSRITVPLMPTEKVFLPAPVPSNQSNLNKPLKREIIKSLFNTCKIVANTEEFIKAAKDTIEDKFDSSSYEFFVSETMNSVLETSTIVRQRYSALLSYMIQENIISLHLFQEEYKKLLEIIDDLKIDIPKCQTYVVEILSGLLTSGVHSFVELKQTLSVLKNSGTGGKFLGELLSILAKNQNPNWVTDKWEKSGLTWSDLFDTKRESVDDIITRYSLKFLIDGSAKIEKVSIENFDFDKTLSQLLNFMRQNNSFDFITNYVTKNFGEQPSEPKFSRCLIIAILTISVDTVNGSQKLYPEKFKQLLPLVIRYVDMNPKRELEVLFGIQHFIHDLWYPQGLLSSVVKIIYDDGIISTDAFLSWQKCEDPVEMEGHAIVIKSLTSFFVNLLEGSDDDSEE